MTIPAGVESIGAYAFSGCSELAEARVPKGCSIGECAFPEGCTVVRYDGDASVGVGGVSVPYSWLVRYPALCENPMPVDSDGCVTVAACAAAASATAANGRAAWECYVAGLDATDESSEFRVGIEIVDGEPVISWSPVLGAEEAAKRKYTVYGKGSLSDEWEEVDGNASDYRFFKVTVEMK